MLINGALDNKTWAVPQAATSVLLVKATTNQLKDPSPGDELRTWPSYITLLYLLLICIFIH